MQLTKVKDVAKLLNTSPRTIRNKISRNEIPHVRIGKLIRVDMEKLKKVMGINDPQDVHDLASEHQILFEFGL